MSERAAWVLWLRAASVRTVRGGAAAAVATIGAQAVFSEIRWDVVVGAALLAMVIEFLLCVASLPEAPAPLDLWGEIERKNGGPP